MTRRLTIPGRELPSLREDVLVSLRARAGSAEELSALRAVAFKVARHMGIDSEQEMAAAELARRDGGR